MKAFISTSGADTFFRCGIQFTKEGKVYDLSDLKEEQVELIRTERNLHAREATKEEIEAAEADHVEPILDDDLTGQIGEIIQLLTAGDFTKDGKPKISAVREALSDDVDAGLVTMTGLHGVFSDLVSKGFQVPAAE